MDASFQVYIRDSSIFSHSNGLILYRPCTGFRQMAQLLSSIVFHTEVKFRLFQLTQLRIVLVWTTPVMVVKLDGPSLKVVAEDSG